MFNEILNTALVALWSNKVRSFLTTLGVIIGVFSVVTLVSLVTGVQNYVTDQFNDIGSNIMYVMPGSGGVGNDPALSFTNNKLSEKHVELIKRDVGKEVIAITPYVATAKTVSYKTKNYYAALSGTNEQSENMFNLKFSEGKFYNAFDVKSKRHVVVLGSDVKEELFKNTKAVGKSIKIDDRTFEIIGVLEKKSQDFDNAVWLPFTTVQQIFDIDIYSYIGLQTKSADNIDYVTKSIEIALLQDLKDDEFTLFSQTDILESVQEILGILQVALGAVAGISLLVGGIGIMNIMLVSVTERTREIGLRKALGATSSNIGLQFIIESIVVSLSGGIVGLFFGWIATLIANNWIRAEITPWSVGLAIGFSIIVGLVFGTYPALDAAKKDPIEALRYE
jgi:putative ABC transport system permease protein